MATTPADGLMRHLRKVALRSEGAGRTDGQLLDSFLTSQDAAAFALLVRRHGPMVFGVCRRVIGHVQDAEDAFQATFLVLARKAASVLPREAVGNWLYGVAYRTARRAKAVAARRRTHEKQVEAMPHPATQEQSDGWHELEPRLDQELSRLPDKYRLPVVLCDLEGRGRREVARRLKLPEGTLSSRLATARKLLAGRLARHGLTLSGAALAVMLPPNAASAGVPASLVVSIAKAATFVAAGKAAAPGVVSAKVAALAEGVMKAMFLTKLKTVVAVLLVVLLLGGASALAYRALAPEKDNRPKAEGQEEHKADRQQLQGTWVGVSFKFNGQESEEKAKAMKLVFAGDRVTWPTKAGDTEGAFQVAPSRTPKEIDVQCEGVPHKGIYRLDGTRLTICMTDGAKRPNAFDSSQGWLLVFEKKDDGPKAKEKDQARVAEDWPQWLGPRRDGVWRETGILDRFPKGGPKALWRVPLGGGYTGPAVAGGRVYVMDRQMPEGSTAEEFRKDLKQAQHGTERILCLSQADGAVLWKHAYDCPYRISYSSGPRTTPVVHDGKVYTLGAMGDLLCLDAITGKVLWSKSLLKEYGLADPPLWGFAAHPLLDGDRLACLVGGDGSAVVAFHKDTGQELWKALTTPEIGYAAPTIVEAGGKRQLVAFLSDSVNGLDPETGKVYWKEKYPAEGKPTRPAVTVATPRQLGDLLFVSGSYDGPLMLRLSADQPGAAVLWRGKNGSPCRPGEHLHCLNATPAVHDGHLYGVGSMGELLCVKAETGEKVWSTYQAIAGEAAGCGTAFLVRQADRFFLFNDQGDLIIANLTPKGYNEIDRAHLIAPTGTAKGRKVVWSHPAFAGRCVFVRNDEAIVCVSLAAP